MNLIILLCFSLLFLSIISQNCTTTTQIGYDSDGRSLTCSIENVFDANISTCVFSRCKNSCPQTVYYYNQAFCSTNCPYVHQCSEGGEGGEGSANIGLIVGIIVGVIALAIIVFCVYKKCNSRTPSSNVAKNPQRNIEIEINDKQLTTQQTVMNNCNFKQPINQKNTCSVCLNEGSNVLLKCNHYLHTKCIAQWGRKNSTCPYCRKKIDDFKVYCQICYNGFTNLRNVQENIKYICKNCQSKQGYAQISIKSGDELSNDRKDLKDRY